MGLFGSGSRLVVFEGVEAWKPPDTGDRGVSQVARPGTTLALVAGDSQRTHRSRRRSPAADAAPLGRLSQGRAQVGSRAVRVDGHSRAGGLSPARRARRRRSLRAGERDHKLVTWADGQAIAAADVGACRSPRRVTAVGPTDAWGARDVGSVDRRMLDRTGDPVRRRFRACSGPHKARAKRQSDPSPRRRGRVLPGSGEPPRAGTRPEAPRAGAELQRARAGRRVDPSRRAGPRAGGGSRLASELELERALVEITAAS
jgi:hypothetical protein